MLIRFLSDVITGQLYHQFIEFIGNLSNLEATTQVNQTMSLNKMIVMLLGGDTVDEACPGKEQTGAISEIIMEFATLRSQRQIKETLLEILQHLV